MLGTSPQFHLKAAKREQSEQMREELQCFKNNKNLFIIKVPTNLLLHNQGLACSTQQLSGQRAHLTLQPKDALVWCFLGGSGRVGSVRE